jgi:chromosome segregation ATPase
MHCRKPWWYVQPSRKAVKHFTQHMKNMEDSIETIKAECQNINMQLNVLHSENTSLVSQRDTAWDTIESLKHQLIVKTNTIRQLEEVLCPTKNTGIIPC